jgi:hypothetical protein
MIRLTRLTALRDARGERDGELIARALSDIFADLQLTPEQRALIPDVVPRRLRELSQKINRRNP